MHFHFNDTNKIVNELAKAARDLGKPKEVVVYNNEQVFGDTIRSGVLGKLLSQFKPEDFQYGAVKLRGEHHHEQTVLCWGQAKLMCKHCGNVRSRTWAMGNRDWVIECQQCGVFDFKPVSARSLAKFQQMKGTHRPAMTAEQEKLFGNGER